MAARGKKQGRQRSPQQERTIRKWRKNQEKRHVGNYTRTKKVHEGRLENAEKREAEHHNEKQRRRKKKTKRRSQEPNRTSTGGKETSEQPTSKYGNLNPMKRSPTGEKKTLRRKDKQGKEHLGKAEAEQNKQMKLETRNSCRAELSQRRKESKAYKTTYRSQRHRKKEQATAGERK